MERREGERGRKKERRKKGRKEKKKKYAGKQKGRGGKVWWTFRRLPGEKTEQLCDLPGYFNLSIWPRLQLTLFMKLLRGKNRNLHFEEMFSCCLFFVTQLNNTWELSTLAITVTMFELKSLFNWMAWGGRRNHKHRHTHTQLKLISCCFREIRQLIHGAISVKMHILSFFLKSFNLN